MGKIKKISKVITPPRSDIESQLGDMMKRTDIQKAYLDYDGNPENFKNGLRKYIELENYKVQRMRKFGSYLDSVNRATIPISIGLDASIIGLGIGTGARAIKTVAISPGYLAYDAYYLGKTHDIIGTLGNLAYEGISWFLPGELPHLIRRYTAQADNYAAHKGADDFLKQCLKKKSNVIDFIEEKNKKQKKAHDLEEMTKAA